MLRLDGFCAAALADKLFLVFHFGQEFDDVAGILLKIFCVAVDGRFQDRSGHSNASLEKRELVYGLGGWRGKNGWKGFVVGDWFKSPMCDLG
jgi:hypothetical protein